MTSFMLDNRTIGNLLRKTELLRDLFQVNRENKIVIAASNEVSVIAFSPKRNLGFECSLCKNLIIFECFFRL